MDKRSLKRRILPNTSAATQTHKHQLDAMLMLLTAGAPLLAATLLVSRPLVLPFLATLWIAGAAVFALLARYVFTVSDAHKVTLWDISGACALIGIAAAIFSDSERIAELFASMDR